MKPIASYMRGRITVLVALLLLVPTGGVWAQVDGLTGTSFNFTAKTGHIITPDAASMMIWGYADDSTGQVQIPGPTLIVNQGDTITVTLNNTLPEPVSLVFPGQQVVATGGAAGLLTQEVPGNDNGANPVTYTFTVTEPGTYTYYSGSHSDLQVEMGLYGALIVRPAVEDLAACPQYSHSAYGDCRSAYDYEFLILQSEMDMDIHHQVENQLLAAPTTPPVIDTAAYHPTIWFLNGRPGPDDLADAGVPWLPAQPYNCLPRGNPGKRVLARMIGAGRDSHPFHTHGNNFDLIARDGRLLESTPGASKAATEVGVVPDLAVSDYTQTTSPGSTYDTIYSWTGQDLGWDIYGTTDGHTCSNPTCPDANGDGYYDGTNAPCWDETTYEYCPDHGKPLPVVLPDIKDLTFGMFYSGSHLLGSSGVLPPGEGGFNLHNGYFHIWHSHNERELTNNDIFPGGMMTFFIVEPPGVPIQ